MSGHRVSQGRLSLVLNNSAGNYTPGLASARIACACAAQCASHFKPPGAGLPPLCGQVLLMVVTGWERPPGLPHQHPTVANYSASSSRRGDRPDLSGAPTPVVAALDDTRAQPWLAKSHLASTQNTLTVTAVWLRWIRRGRVGALPIDDGTVAAFTPVDVSNGCSFTGSASVSTASPTSLAGVCVDERDR